ncbi:MAG TPA: protein jag [Caldilineae bacterium]|nr:protein jag [Caldilineae bacterium]
MTEFVGRTVEEAIETGLATLNLNRDQAEIEILEEGRTGVFGVGSRPATVRITARGSAPAPPTSAEEDAEMETTSTDQISGQEPDSDHGVVASTEVGEQGQKRESATLAEESELTMEAELTPLEPVELTEEEEVLSIAQDFLQNMLNLMGLKTQVEASVVEPDENNREQVFLLNIEGEDLGILIGRRGETLDSIQYLVRLVVNRYLHNWPRIEVDVEHYKERRTLSLQRLANTMADKAVREKRTVVLEAMPARERRLVHIALRNRDDVYTESVGEDENRKVSIIPS